MKQLLGHLDNIGFEGSRRALAALVLSLFTSLFLLISLNAPPGTGPMLLALGACYLVAFMAVVAEWFWGRWFASGLAWSGLMVSVFGLIKVGWIPPLAIYGALHGLVVVALLGKKMAARYDMQEAWRKRFGMDEFGVARLRKTVTRASASLPSLIVMVLGPKEPGQGMAVTALGIGTLLLAAAGLRGVIRMRSWGVLALAASCVGVSLFGAEALSFYGADRLWSQFGGFGGAATASALLGIGTTLSAVLLALAVVPFLGPALRFIRDRR